MGSLLKRYEQMENMYDDINTYETVFNNMIVVVGNAMHLMLYLRNSMLGIKKNFDSTMTDDQRLLSVKIHDVKKMEPFELLQRYFLNYIQNLGYRKYGDLCYERVMTETNYFTHAWRKKDEIKELVINL